MGDLHENGLASAGEPCDTGKGHQLDAGLQESFQNECLEKAKQLNSRWVGQRNAAIRDMEHCVGGFVRSARESTKGRLERDPRMPRVVNYLERYAVMKAVAEKDKLLYRIGQTIDDAEKAIKQAQSLDLQSAVSEAADAFRICVQRLSEVAVCAPEQQGGIFAGGEMPALDIEDRMRVLDALSKCIETPFSEALRSVLDKGSSESDGVAESLRFQQELSAAENAAEQAYGAVTAANAQAASGRFIETGDIPRFDAVVSCELRYDMQDLPRLVELVRASFETYKQVLADNGLFAAFSEGSEFGKCSGYSNWMSAWDDWAMEECSYDYSEYFGGPIAPEYVRSRIPTRIEDVDDDGDGLPTVIARMEAFCKEKYWGMLDDNFKHFVDVFWYGFGKLMEFVNDMAKVDLTPFLRYEAQVQDLLVARGGNLGALMDRSQLSDFRKRIDQLAEQSME